MKQTWLLIDTNYIIHRLGRGVGFNAEGLGDGWVPDACSMVVHEIRGMCDLFQTQDVVCCFDGVGSKRKSMVDNYKANRDRDEVYERIKKVASTLRDGAMHKAGFRNVFHANGYEADDQIAMLSHGIPKKHEAIIVTADKDMYQLLRDNVIMWHPKNGVTTKATFIKEYGISPGLWPDVKALAGCSSDNIKGVVGVGEKTAIKFLRHELKPTSKAYKAITMEGCSIWQMNLPLVKLPLYGVPKKRPH